MPDINTATEAAKHQGQARGAELPGSQVPANESRPRPSFADAMARGYDEILILRLHRRAGREVRAPISTSPFREIGGAWDRGFDGIQRVTRLPRGPLRGSLDRWIVISVWPLVAAFVIRVAGIDVTVRQWTFLAFAAAVTAGATGAAYVAWGYVENRARLVDKMLREPADSHRTEPWSIFNTCYRPWVQAAWCVPIATALTVYVYTNSSWDRTPLALRLVLVIAAWNAFAFVANDVMWLAVPPTLVYRMAARSLRRSSFVGVGVYKLRWNDPARTPGLAVLSSGLLAAAGFLTLAAITVSVPQVVGQDVLGDALLPLYVVLVVLALWTGVGTQAAILWMVRHEKLRQLNALAALKASGPTAADAVGPSEQFASLYAQVDGAPSMPNGLGFLVQAAAVAASIVTTFVT